MQMEKNDDRKQKYTGIKGEFLVVFIYLILNCN